LDEIFPNSPLGLGCSELRDEFTADRPTISHETAFGRNLAARSHTFLMHGARPKLTPIIGMLTPPGIPTNDATLDIRPSLVSAVKQLQPGPLIVGVKVVNAGRAPLHVAGWAVRADPSGTSSNVLGEQIGSPEVPCDIPARAEQTFSCTSRRGDQPQIDCGSD
jgi:hypothetical protein